MGLAESLQHQDASSIPQPGAVDLSCSIGHNCCLDLIPGLGMPYDVGHPKKKEEKNGQIDRQRQIDRYRYRYRYLNIDYIDTDMYIDIPFTMGNPKYFSTCATCSQNYLPVELSPTGLHYGSVQNMEWIKLMYPTQILLKYAN